MEACGAFVVTAGGLNGWNDDGVAPAMRSLSPHSRSLAGGGDKAALSAPRPCWTGMLRLLRVKNSPSLEPACM